MFQILPEINRNNALKNDVLVYLLKLLIHR